MAADARAVCEFDFRDDAADADRDGAAPGISHPVSGDVSECGIAGGGGCNLQDAEAVLAMPPRFRRVILLDAMRA